MQVKLNKVKVTDPRSTFYDQIVDLVIEDGIIKSIKAAKSTSAKAATVISNDDGELWKGKPGDILCISPGWVDVFADYREPGYEAKETMATGLNAAAAGGFTDVLLVPNTLPTVSTRSAVESINHKAAGNIVSAHVMGAASKNTEGKELAEMLDMRAAGAIAFTDGWKPVQNAGLLLKALEYVKAFDGTIVQLPIDTDLAAGGLMNEGINSTMLGMAGIPAIAETLAVHRYIELVRYTGSKLHITGISTAEAADMVRYAKAEGLAITCSVTPYHLALTDDMLTTYDSAYKVSPPLRTETDRMALIDALADGTIDCIASHHRPHEWDAKVKEFEYAGDGMAIQESAWQLMWDAVNEYVDAGRMAEVMSSLPRDIFGLPDATIEKGRNASITLFSTDGTSAVTKENKQSLAYNHPFIGKQLAGRVVGIINNQLIKLK